MSVKTDKRNSFLHEENIKSIPIMGRTKSYAINIVTLSKPHVSNSTKGSFHLATLYIYIYIYTTVSLI